MASVSEYQKQIDMLDIEGGLNKKVSSSEEARDVKKSCIAYQRELRQIKKSVGLEIKAIRTEYRDKIVNAGSVVGGAFSLFGKRGLGGNIRADAKRATTRERDSIISPYEDFKLLIDQYIHAIDDAKVNIEGYIQELKAEEPKSENKAKETNPTTGRFCGACGAKAAKSHKFCTQCGQKLDET